MKRNQLLSVLIGMLLIFSWQSKVYAQKADTVTVIAPMPGDLYNFIEKDTLANGNRVNPNRYYRLERGKVYVVKGIMYFRHDLNLIADDDDPRNPTRPPMLVNGKLADGSNNTLLIALMKNQSKCLFKNIFFQGVSTDRKEEDDNEAISIVADSVRLIVDKCVFNAFGLRSIDLWGRGNKLYIRNNNFRNHVRAQPFKGQLIANAGALYMDTVVITNNTSFNNNSYFWEPGSSIIRYEKIEHNTIYTSIVNTLYSPWMANSEIKDNIFYSALSYGQLQSEVNGGWYDFQNSLSSIISVTKSSSFQLGLNGMTEEGRKIDVSNNNYFWPQKIKDNWSTMSLIASDLWMNTRTVGYFGDKTTYPNFSNSNNLNLDPIFDTQMEKIVLDSLIYWVNNFRTNNRSTYRNYNIGSTDLLLPTWPLPENLAYTNPQLMTAGHDGLPIGDLNWFPEAKKVWEALNNVTGLQSIYDQGENMLHLTNYPNPANHYTTFTFSLPQFGKTTLNLFNIEGKQVATIVASELSSGVHSFEFDTRKIAQGVYVYHLISGNYIERNKLIVIK